MITCLAWHLLTSASDFSPQISEPRINFVAKHYKIVNSASATALPAGIQHFLIAKMPVPVSAPGSHGSHGPSLFDKSMFFPPINKRKSWEGGGGAGSD